jgi:hypothetical protein
MTTIQNKRTGNSVTVENYSDREEAIAVLNDMDEGNNYDCRDCRNIVDCVGCEDCDDCEECEDCTNCFECITSLDSVNCEYSDNLEGCSNRKGDSYQYGE